jgi:hypothetical protein
MGYAPGGAQEKVNIEAVPATMAREQNTWLDGWVIFSTCDKL